MGAQDWEHSELNAKRESTRDMLFGRALSTSSSDSAHQRPGDVKRPTYERYSPELEEKYNPSPPAPAEVHIPIGSGSQ